MQQENASRTQKNPPAIVQPKFRVQPPIMLVWNAMIESKVMSNLWVVGHLTRRATDF